ncbi:26S proteasome non-ATPase regulatory subunit, putative [Entamoeba histolytica HM-1:IMSS-B]|uniref:Proteasome regulatory subunit, putative n=6 Tax=Entamoeba histolytica TaxID=5759 RepID=C4M451_ENTH1|nr:proteasome regulatory subunit, putative [Entamoeba histolytica HM-1:IMSS]EMD46040.1 proteasome regulatory subunit, putative [Entamoeba histolytica KU27]EMH75334.1 26S proteasome non-ATPase regulatory subunit, putative [Entamoeba histolytica HM-1:IMSS-B]EMS10930.1 proteasome regulatory subunit [Entamoeba histolytica HM-3:IMSS]ENY61896.1 proteasome regulatory subunit, putative [Entamoeba histolytica HM-1:IMSS-A]GAT96127.1 26s proteasome non-ATPase regulatory subunit putative [Entamoeba histol|eukprot:XP_649261.1 proteasome regulatory subunit, putative [Entamoeba histolytica HM-1:IMSS]
MTEPLQSSYIKKVIVHPLVLLSISDHQTRASKEGKRVVGVLLGFIRKGIVDVMNSFAVPFDEDEKDNIWYLDHQYLETVYRMTQRVTAKEVLVGWYSTSSSIKPCDIQIHSVINKYTAHPVYLTVDVSATVSHDLPVHSYVSAESIDSSENILLQPELSLRFIHVPTDVGSDESEVGVERLLRDLQKPTGTVLKHEVELKMDSLRALDDKIKLMRNYLELVESGKIPVNQKIIQNIQDIFNLSPNIEKYTQQFAVNTNDVMVTIYLSQLVKSVLAVHDLIRNKNDYEIKLKQLHDNNNKEPIKDDSQQQPVVQK